MVFYMLTNSYPMLIMGPKPSFLRQKTKKIVIMVPCLT